MSDKIYVIKNDGAGKYSRDPLAKEMVGQYMADSRAPLFLYRRAGKAGYSHILTVASTKKQLEEMTKRVDEYVAMGEIKDLGDMARFMSVPRPRQPRAAAAARASLTDKSAERAYGAHSGALSMSSINDNLIPRILDAFVASKGVRRYIEYQASTPANLVSLRGNVTVDAAQIRDMREAARNEFLAAMRTDFLIRNKAVKRFDMADHKKSSAATIIRDFAAWRARNGVNSVLIKEGDKFHVQAWEVYIKHNVRFFEEDVNVTGYMPHAANGSIIVDNQGDIAYFEATPAEMTRAARKLEKEIAKAQK